VKKKYVGLFYVEEKNKLITEFQIVKSKTLSVMMVYLNQ